MTPKEKAKELVGKMYLVDNVMGIYPMCFRTSKQCALIAVDEILMSYDTKHLIYPKEVKYWQQVKQEIEKL